MASRIDVRAGEGGQDSRPPVLEARGLVKRFPGVVALSGVSFDVRAGEVHALCGENGAGKSTLIKTLGGVHPAGSYEGEVLLDGKPAAFGGTRDAREAGIAVIYQELALVPEMSVAENVFLGDEPRRGGGLLIDWPRVERESRALLERFGLRVDPSARVSELGVGHRQLVEIAKALAKRTRVLILDEPTAALSGREVEALLQIVRDLRAQGIAIMYISHRLEEVFAIADRITVLRDGRSVATLEAAAATPREVIRHMVGREIADLFPKRRKAAGAVRLAVRGLSATDDAGRPMLEDVSLEAREGEVLGIGGLMGAGRTELLMHLFGAMGRRTAGAVLLDGQVLGPGNTPAQSLRRGLVLVSEDRKRYGLVLEREIGFNLSLSSIGRMCRAGVIDEERETREELGVFRSLRIKAAGLATEVRTLSGGNQQKVVLGKALLVGPRVILLDEPTRGVDVGAKVEVYELINRLTDAGQAVVLVSSELPELIGMSDRVVMLAQGRVGGVFERGEITPERLIAAAMAGGAAMAAEPAGRSA